MSVFDGLHFTAAQRSSYRLLNMANIDLWCSSPKRPCFSLKHWPKSIISLRDVDSSERRASLGASIFFIRVCCSSVFSRRLVSWVSNCLRLPRKESWLLFNLSRNCNKRLWRGNGYDFQKLWFWRYIWRNLNYGEYWKFWLISLDGYYTSTTESTYIYCSFINSQFTGRLSKFTYEAQFPYW